MTLTNIFIKNIEHTGATSGDKYTDGRALYLLVNAVGKYWRMDYRFVGKRKTLALESCRTDLFEGDFDRVIKPIESDSQPDIAEE